MERVQRICKFLYDNFLYRYRKAKNEALCTRSYWSPYQVSISLPRSGHMHAHSSLKSYQTYVQCAHNVSGTRVSPLPRKKGVGMGQRVGGGRTVRGTAGGKGERR